MNHPPVETLLDECAHIETCPSCAWLAMRLAAEEEIVRSALARPTARDWGWLAPAVAVAGLLSLALWLLWPATPADPLAPAQDDAFKVTLKGSTFTVDWRRTDTVRRGRVGGKPPLLLGWPRARHQHHRTDGDYDVAFLAADGAVLELAAAKRGDERGIACTKEAPYALFLEPGWCERHGLRSGDRAALAASILKSPPEEMPEVRVGGVALRVEFATTASERRRGLNHRPALSTDEGFLFVYTREHAPLMFGAVDCRFPLDVAFFDAKGAIVKLASLDVFPEARVSCEAAAQYVLEVNKGWFARHGLSEKAKLELPASIRPFDWTAHGGALGPGAWFDADAVGMISDGEVPSDLAEICAAPSPWLVTVDAGGDTALVRAQIWTEGERRYVRLTLAAKFLERPKDPTGTSRRREVEPFPGGDSLSGVAAGWPDLRAARLVIVSRAPPTPTPGDLVKTLVAGVAHANETVRRASAHALRHIVSVETIGACLKAMEDASESVRTVAWESLRALAGADASAFRPGAAAAERARQIAALDVWWSSKKGDGAFLEERWGAVFDAFK